MQDASTRRKHVLRVTQEFETSRLEKGLLAAVYERAVPIITRRPNRSLGNDLELANSYGEMNLQPSLTTERHVG